MFAYARAFNQNIGLWNIANAINMTDIFNTLMSPVSKDQFYESYLAKKALHIKGNPDKFKDYTALTIKTDAYVLNHFRVNKFNFTKKN